MADVIVNRVSTIPATAGGDNLYVFEGSQTINANVDHSAIAALGRVFVAREFTGNIVNLTCGVTGELHYDAGGGSMSVAANDSGTNIIVTVWHTGLGALTAQTSGTITNWQQKSGTGAIMDGIIVTNIHQEGGTLTQLYKSDANTLVVAASGSLYTGRAATTMWVGNANVVMKREDTSAVQPTIGTLNMVGPGTVDFYGEGLTTVNFYHPKARLRVAGTYAGGANMTITTITGFATAIAASGLPMASAGVVTTKSGYTITATTVTPWGSKVEFANAGGIGGSGGFT